jgi:hypothetical protein
MENKDQKTNIFIGIAAIRCVFSGTASLIAALFPFVIGDFLSASIFQVAASLSFGPLAIALFKK